MRLSVVTGPQSEPVSLLTARHHLRLDVQSDGVHMDDDLVTGIYIPAARDYLERHTGRRLVSQTLRATLGAWPGDRIDLPVLPVSSIESITYFDADNVQQSLASSSYALDADEWSGSVVRASGAAWPSVYDRPDAISINFVAGYTSVPPALLHALLLLLGHAYENREATILGAVDEMPFGVQSAVATFSNRFGV